MAKETMQLVIDIDREAHKLARTAVVEVRTHDAHNRFHAVRDIAKNAGNLASLDSPIKHLETRLNQISTTFTNHSRRLDNLLEHIVDSMRATNAISASCRVEASRAGEFRESLTVVANNFEHSVTIIKQKVMDCHKRLLDAQK
jgi:methyl-accepting chemotaxis protein